MCFSKSFRPYCINHKPYCYHGDVISTVGMCFSAPPFIAADFAEYLSSYNISWEFDSLALSTRRRSSLQWRHNERDASKITGFSIVCSTVCSGVDQRKHQNPPSLAFVRGIHRWPVYSLHKWPVTRKCFHSTTSSWNSGIHQSDIHIFAFNKMSVAYYFMVRANTNVGRLFRY